MDLNPNGDLNLQDGQFSCEDLQLLLADDELKQHKESIDASHIKLFLSPRNLDLNKSWKALEKSHKNVQLVNQASLNEASEGSWQSVLSGLSSFLNERPVEQMMETSKFTGTLRIQKPILYIFPALEGDSAFFTINGYSMLINGGYDRVRPCFWKFVNMLQQIDSVLITHNDCDALGGLSSFFGKKLLEPELKPTVLSVLANLVASVKGSASTETNGATTAANLIASEIATSKPISGLSDSELILEAIERLKIKLMPLVKSEAKPASKPEHINLYYKLGHGSLDLYVLSPFANSTDYKEFIQQQQSQAAKLGQHKSHLSVNQIFKQIPSSHCCSAVVLLVWSPVSRESSSGLRLLFTGNAPQHIVLNALEKAKDLDILSTPVYKVKNGESQQVVSLPVKKAEKVAGQANTSLNSAKATSQPNSKGNAVPTNATTEPQAKQSNRVSNIHPNSAKEIIQTKPQEKQSEKASATSAKPSKPTTATNGTAKEAPVPNVAKKPSGSTHDAKKKPKENEEDKPVKEETKITTKSSSAPITKPNGVTSQKEPKSTKSDTNNINPVSKVTSAPTSSKSDTQPKPTAAKPTSSVKPPAAPKATSSASSKEVGKKPVAKKEEVKKEVKEPHEPKIVGKKNAKPAETAKTEVKPVSGPEVTVQVKPQASAEPNPTEEIQPTTVEAPIETASNIITEPLVENAKEEVKVEITGQEEASTTEEIVEAGDAEVPEETPNKELAVEEEQEEEAQEEEKEIVGNNLSEVQEEAEEPVEMAKEVEKEDKIQELEICEETNGKDLLVETCNSSNSVQTNNYCEWPNLSPVKKDQNDDLIEEAGEELHSGENRDSSAIEAPEDQDKEVRPPVDLPLILKNDCSENMVISDSRDLIASPIACDSHAEKSFGSHDIMTRSFIDDGSQSNPFAAPVDEPVLKVHKASHDDSDLNDLNKTHELFADESQEDDVSHENKEEEDTQPINLVEVVNNTVEEKLVEVMCSLTIQSKLESQEIETEKEHNHEISHVNELPKENGVFQQNGHHQENGEHKEVEDENLVLTKLNNDICQNGHNNTEDEHEESHKPNKSLLLFDSPNSEPDARNWDLLQLPRPVNPSDSLLAQTGNAASNILDKKLTPNGKKANPATLQSPSQNNATNSDASKTAVKHQTNNGHAKIKSTNGLGIHPVYVEVSYIPAHGNVFYVDAEFFKKVRARHYVLSTEEPSESILNAIIEAKETWEDKNMQVSIIPTYESEVIRRWFISNEENLARLKIDILPAANLATLTMDDNPDLSCQCYKLEF